MKVIVSGGGTAGHVYPALSIVNKLKEHHPDAQFLYIGTKSGLEAEIVKQAGIPFEAIQVSGLKRKISMDNIKTLWQFITAIRHSKRLIKRFKPEIVIGTGGYVSGPVVYAASKLGIPTLIHEQNVVPGLANLFLSRYVSAVAVSFEESKGQFRHPNIIVTGNPRASEVVRRDGKKVREELGLAADQKLVLIVGGSRGAEAINQAFLQMADKIKERPDCHFLFITGHNHFDRINKQLEPIISQSRNLTVKPFIYNMPDVLAATDLIVNRAGASFLAELTALGIPSILVPSPYVTNNHQEKNARWLEKEGASYVILEKDLSGSRLWETIIKIIDNPSLRVTMNKASLRLGKPDAQEQLYRLILNLIERS